jgi:hypothetical protein
LNTAKGADGTPVIGTIAVNEPITTKHMKIAKN